MKNLYHLKITSIKYFTYTYLRFCKLCLYLDHISRYCDKLVISYEGTHMKTHIKNFPSLICLHCQCTHWCWILHTGSSYRSLISKSRPRTLTSGCFFTMSHPICAKKNPLLALCGSASVSENLWWTRWSRAHSIILFCFKEKEDQKNTCHDLLKCDL